MDTSLNPGPFFPASMSPARLAFRMGRADAPLLLDVRREAAFLASAHMLAGAQRCAPEAVTAFAAAQRALYPRREVVVYCVHGHQVSGDAATALRAAGWNASQLAGGFEGGEAGVDTPQDIAQWRAHRPQTVLKRADWGVTGTSPSRWITRARPKIDRIACPWLIRRFIDPQAMFFYVPTSAVLAEAARLGAVAFDIPGAPVSHEGALCSFDVLLRAFGLTDPALGSLARIVRGADTDCLDLAPESAGLLAFSLGLSQLYHDDHAMLAAAMPLYDALYARCHSVANAAGHNESAETHSWTPETMMDTPQ